MVARSARTDDDTDKTDVIGKLGCAGSSMVMVLLQAVYGTGPSENDPGTIVPSLNG